MPDERGPDRPPRRKPPWWPAEEPWPPPRDPRGRRQAGGPWRSAGPWQDRGPWGRRRRGFGCLFGFLFFAFVILVLASIVAVASGLVATAGPLALVVVGGLAIAAFVAFGRFFRHTAATLDELVDVVHRVEAGDYSVRVDTPVGGPRALRELVLGVDTMVARLDADEGLRRSMLADVSHELRTPLTVIAGNLEAIVDGVYPADEAHLSAILDETRVLERLIEDLRTLALSEAGTLALHREPTDLDILVADVARSFQAAADAAGVALTADAPDDLPILDVDPVRTREVLANLVSNAIRHTPAGGSVTVTAGLDDDSVRIAVRDSGPGIDPELLPHVFDRFAHGSEAHGSGLGLAIARHLVEAHGGTIGLDSTPGEGTTAWFRLPLA